MTFAEVAALVFAAAAVVAAGVTRRPAGAAVAACTGCVAVAAIAAVFALHGARWQVVPAAVAAFGTTASALVRVARARRASTVPSAVGRRGLVRIGGCVLGCGLVGSSAALVWALPVFRLPQPTGPFPVGTTVRELPDDHRPVVMQLWYPAASDRGGRAWYFGRDGERAVVARGLARTYGIPSPVLDGAVRARSSSVLDAAPADGGAPWAAVVFSPGLTSVRTQSTMWAEDLASHGYLVVAVDHPFDSAAFELSDGRVVTTRVRATGDDTRDDAAADEATAARAGDLRRVADFLERATAPSSGDVVLSGRVDLSRLAVAGHSLGGAAALQAAAEDPRFRAAVDIDGMPRNQARPRGPVLVLVAGRGTGNDANDERYEAEVEDVVAAADSRSKAITVPGAAHLSFTDAPLLLPPLPSLVGSGGREAGSRAASNATRAFLEAVLSST